MKQIYLDRTQCTRLGVPYMEAHFSSVTLPVKEILDSKSKLYDKEHRDFLEPLLGASIEVSKNPGNAPGWYTIVECGIVPSPKTQEKQRAWQFLCSNRGRFVARRALLIALKDLKSRPLKEHEMISDMQRILDALFDDDDLGAPMPIEEVDSLQDLCEEHGGPFDDNPGKSLCKTCEDWKADMASDEVLPLEAEE